LYSAISPLVGRCKVQEVQEGGASKDRCTGGSSSRFLRFDWMAEETRQSDAVLRVKETVDV